MINFTLKPETNYVYVWFTWSASNCSPNRDGGTGEMRVDSRRRVFTTQECFNQNVKNGVFYATQSGLINAKKDGSELFGCKNEYFLGDESLSRKKATYQLLNRLGTLLDKKPIVKEDVFNSCFDLPLFGFVNSDCLEDDAIPKSFTGSAGLIYLPKTVTQVIVSNRGISNSFANPPKSSSAEYKAVKTSSQYEDELKKGKDPLHAQDMPGSHYSDFLEEGVFSSLAFVNVKQLGFVAEQKFGMTDKTKIRERIAELANLYLLGIWEGFKLLGYVSSMRKGQQPLAMFAAQRTTLADYVSDPSDLLSDDKGTIPMHNNIPDTISKLKIKFNAWKNVFDEKDMQGMTLVEKSSPWGE